MKIAFDVGGVLSKYPQILGPLLEVLHYNGDDDVEVWIVSDMHPIQKIIDMLELNGLAFLKHRVISADYSTYGEASKGAVCREFGIDVLVDDFIGYVGVAGKPLLRLLVMPDATQPYYHDEWKTDGIEGDFGRRKRQP